MNTKLNHKLFSKLTVVQVPYWGNSRAKGNDNAVVAFREMKLYDGCGPEPVLVTAEVDAMELAADDSLVDRLGMIGAAICKQVSVARRSGNSVLMSGGQCHHTPGVVGGLQQAHGADTRVGLIWLDAHGDFNTPRTTLSGSLGGMPVAVIAGLAWPEWREACGMVVPLPTDRIIHSDGRDLDVPERALLEATSVTRPAITPATRGSEFYQAVQSLAERCDVLYLHIDEDILDAPYVPSHGTIAEGGPSLDEVNAAIECVMATGKVAVCSLVSVYCTVDNGITDIESGTSLIRAMLKGWQQFGGV